MTPAQDPFYIVKDEIQDSIDKVQDTFHQWKQTPENTGEYVHLTKEILASCESIQWQVDELEKAISVAERDPAYYGLAEVEIGKRRNWTSTARNQVVSIRRNIEAGKQKSVFGHSVNPSESGRSKRHMAQDNDDFISSESDQQMLLIKRQDEELDALSASVQRIGGVGLTIHDELVGQEKLLGELSLDMETTSNRLDFVQIDRSAVESFGCTGRVCITARVYPVALVDGGTHMYAFNNGTSTVKVSQLKAWSMRRAQVNVNKG